MKTAQEMYQIALPIREATEVAEAAARKERKAMVLAAIMQRIEDAANRGDLSCFLDINNDYPEADQDTMNALRGAGYAVECTFCHDEIDDVYGWHVSWHPKRMVDRDCGYCRATPTPLWGRIKSWFVGCET